MKLNEGEHTNEKNNKDSVSDNNLESLPRKEESSAQKDGFRYDYDDNF